MKQILDFTLEYLKQHLQDFKLDARGKVKVFICPKCREMTANFIPYTKIIFCHSKSCHGGSKVGDLVDVVRLLEEDKKDKTNEEILSYLAEQFKLPFLTEQDIARLLDLYEKFGFDLVPVAPNDKKPIEKAWPLQTHKTKSEWKEWLEDGLNIGIKTGKVSNITVVDIDTKDLSILPKEIQEIFANYKGVYQETLKGTHYFFQYCADIPKTRLDQYKIDIENDGGQVICQPSIADDVGRKFIVTGEIPQMPEAIKQFILKCARLFNSSEALAITSDVASETLSSLDLSDIKEGGRTNALIRLGGVLRKKLNINDTEHVLDIFNKYFCKPALPQREFINIVKSLDKYINFDSRDLAGRILNYLRIVQEASARDIKEVVEEKKENIDKALAFLVKEGYVLKHKRFYKIIQKAEWKDTFFHEGQEINYKMPYFHDCAIFRFGDMIVMGGTQKVGKSTVVMNVIKRLVAQGIKPYLLNLESGNRFSIISRKLGLIEGSYWYVTTSSPEQIELEDNAFTIIDWLLPKDYAETDKIFQRLSEQLIKHKGILLVVVQLKPDNSFFAPSMIAMFPSFVCKYIYDDEEGVKGHFQVEQVREPKRQYKRGSIPCVYDFESRELKRVDEIEEQGEESIL